MSQPANTLALRVGEVRREIFGEDGVRSLAKALGLPARAWQHYEAGVTIPATVILAFIQLTGVEPHWLLAGDGDRYRQATDEEKRMPNSAWRAPHAAKRPLS
jgi:hypothetical protein